MTKLTYLKRILFFLVILTITGSVHAQDNEKWSRQSAQSSEFIIESPKLNDNFKVIFNVQEEDFNLSLISSSGDFLGLNFSHLGMRLTGKNEGFINKIPTLPGDEVIIESGDKYLSVLLNGHTVINLSNISKSRFNSLIYSTSGSTTGKLLPIQIKAW